MADQQVIVPGISQPLSFPEGMSTQDMGVIIRKNFPHVDPERAANQAMNRAKPGGIFNGMSGPQAPQGNEGLSLGDSLNQLVPPTPSPSVATPEGSARRAAKASFTARTRGAASEAAGMSVAGPKTSQEVGSPLDYVLNAADRERTGATIQMMRPGKQRDALQQRLEYSNRAVGGSGENASPLAGVGEETLNDSKPFWKAADAVLAMQGGPQNPQHFFTKTVPEFFAPHQGTDGNLELGDNRLHAAERAIGGGAWRAIEGLPTLENAALAVGGSLPAAESAGIGKAMNIGFTAMQGKAAGQQAIEAYQKFKNRDFAGGVGSATDAAFQALFGGLSALHATHGEMSEKLATRMKAELDAKDLADQESARQAREAEQTRQRAVDFSHAQQTEFNFGEPTKPNAPAQASFGFDWTLPKQEAATSFPDKTGQLPLFPHQAFQQELPLHKADEVAAGIPEGPSAQTRFEFPEQRAQGRLDFNKEVPVPSPQTPPDVIQPTEAKAAEPKLEEPKPTPPEPTPSSKPSLGEDTSAPALEAPMRDLVGKIFKTRRLQASAQRRLQVEFALKDAASGGKQSPEDKALGLPPGQPIVKDNKLPYAQLDAEDKAKVDAVAQALGLGKDMNLPAGTKLEAQHYYLSADQVKQLKSMRSQGLRPFSLKGTGHPEEAFGEGAHYPLADINARNAQAAGIPRAKDLWGQLSESDQKAHKEFQAAYQKGSDAQTEDAGGHIVGQREAVQGGTVTSGGKDSEVLQHEHDMMQKVLAARLKGFQEDLTNRIPAWRAARLSEDAPSKLSQDVAALSAGSRAGLPKELYAKEHLSPKTEALPKSPVVQEPVPSAKAPESGTGPQASELPKKQKSSPADVIADIKRVSAEITKTHGQEAFNAMGELFDIASAKYKVPDNVNRAVRMAMEKYQEHLDLGTKDPIKAALRDSIAGLPDEKPGQTLYANPLGPIWNKMFGPRPTVSVRASLPGPLALTESPLHQVTEDIINRRGTTNQSDLPAFFKNEKEKLLDTVNQAPNDVRSIIDKAKDLTQKAWDLYKTRPGLSPLEWALGYRRLQLSANSIVLNNFHREVLKMHKDVVRREAMVNYLQAEGGVSPDSIVNAELQLKANTFDPTRSREDFKLHRGYKEAMNLTKDEKATVAKYRQYDAYLNKQEVAAGVETHAVANYIKQVWSENSLRAKGIEAMFRSGEFATTDSFQMMRKYQDYFEGETNGLRAQRKDFAYLVEARARASSEVLANRALVHSLYTETNDLGEKLAMPNGIGSFIQANPAAGDKAGALLVQQARPGSAVTKDGRSYKEIDHHSFRNWKWVGTAEGGLDANGVQQPDTNVLYKGNMLIHPDLYDDIKRILEPSAIRSNPVGKALLGLSSIGKQTLLVGLFHPIQLGIHSLEHAMQPKTSPRAIKALNPMSKSIIDLEKDLTQQMLVVHGLILADYHGDGTWDEGVMSRGFANAAPIIGAPIRALHDAMFQRFIPNLKMATALDAVERNMDRYHDQYKAEELAKPGATQQTASLQAQSRIYRMTASQMNSAFGGINWEHLKVNRTVQDAARLLVLAPDFLLARAQFPLDAMRPGGRESLRPLLTGFALQYVAARAFNYAMNDGDAKMDPHDWNKFIVGKHSYSLRTVQGDMMDAALDTRKFLTHRLNPMWRPGVEGLITHRDVFGHPADAAQQVFDATQNITPMPLQGITEAVAHHFDPNLRGSSQGEGVYNAAISSMTGVFRQTYHTPAERIVFNHFDETEPGDSTSDLAIEQKRTFQRLRSLYQEGKLTDTDVQNAMNDPKGNLKASEAEYLYKTQNETQLVIRARHLPVDQQLEAWDHASPMEKAQLAPLIQHSALKQLAPAEAEKVIDKVLEFRKNLSSDENDKINGQIDNELDWEQHRYEQKQPQGTQ